MSAETQTAARVAHLIANCADSHAEIAEKLGVDKSLVTRFRSGKRKPTETQLAKLEELYGSPAAPKSKPAALPEPPGLDDEEDDADDEDADLSDAPGNARLRKMIRAGMREIEIDPDLSGVKKAEALKKLVDAQVALDKSSGENALTMQRIVAHPEFQRVVRLITEAIAPYPDALRAASAALEAVRS